MEIKATSLMSKPFYFKENKMAVVNNVVVDNSNERVFIQTPTWTTKRFGAAVVAEIATLFVSPMGYTPIAVFWSKEVLVPLEKVEITGDLIKLKEQEKIEKKLPENFSFLVPANMPKIKVTGYTGEARNRGLPIYDSSGKKLGYIYDYLIDTESCLRTAILIKPNRLGEPKESIKLDSKKVGYGKIGMLRKALIYQG